jgi:hypothetical protein
LEKLGIAGNLKYTWHNVGVRKYKFLHHIGKAGSRLSKEITNSQHIPALAFLIPANQEVAYI